MEELILQLIELIPQLKAGAIGGFGALVMLLVRVYRLPEVQGLLPARLQWKDGAWAGLLIVGVVTLLVSVGGGVLVGGIPLQAALLAALPTALTAIIGHKSSQAIGAALRTPAAEVAAVASQPATVLPKALNIVKRASDIVLPPPGQKNTSGLKLAK